MLDKLQAHQVVIFRESGSPIDVPPEKWAVTFHRKSATLRLRHGGFRVNYDLRHDLICLVQTDEKQVTALGRTVGRMALTGISTRLFFGGKGMAGAMLDLSARGAEKNTIMSGMLVFNDTTMVSFKAHAEDYFRFRAMLPQECVQPSSPERAEKLFDLVHRMTLDGARVLRELDDEVTGVAEALKRAEVVAESGDEFAVRDRARLEAREFRQRLAELAQVKRAVAFQLKQPLIPEKVESSTQPRALPPAQPSSLSPNVPSVWQKMPLIPFLAVSLVVVVIVGAAGFVLGAIIGTVAGVSEGVVASLALGGFALGCIMGIRYLRGKRRMRLAESL